MQQILTFDPDLIRRFDIPGPRYTSYPTADRFTDAFGPSALQEHLGLRAGGGLERPLSLYFHIPFCNTICYYCACNKVITKDRALSAKYIDYLGREMVMQAAHLEGSSKVVQMHFGGGTPTFLSTDETRRLMASIRRHFELVPDGEYSIEVDPRKVTPEHVALLAEEGFNRMSVGVQDFDPVVQQAVNRIQSVDETLSVIEAARQNGFRSISIDLIYGLPHQDVERFGATLDIVLSMQPDRLALYNYAHLPARFMPQRRINGEDLPSADDKLKIFALAVDKLASAGYVYIGMDHFSRPDDELAVAQRKGFLQRNFQGYSTHAECDLLAFGVSSIGKVNGAFSQNQRDLDAYYAAIDQGELPVMRGWVMSREDIMRNVIIQSLMCHFALSFEAIEASFGIDFRETFAPELRDLAGLEQAGLVIISDGHLTVTDAGRVLVRIIAMVFDSYLRHDQQQRRYSRII